MKRKNKIFQADLAAFKLMGYVLVFIWGMLCFLPFLLVVMNSFTAEANIMRNGYSFWPGEWTLEAYNTCLETRKESALPTAIRLSLPLLVQFFPC